jgi:RNA polymerase sigma-70 factor, ECF subfamily
MMTLTKPLPEMPRSPRDADLFLRLLMANHRQLLAFIFLLHPNWADAEDIFQETTAVLWQKFAEFAPDTEFLTWSRTFARFQVMRYRKARPRPVLELQAELIESLVVTSDAAEFHASRRLNAVQNCVAKLSAQDQQLIQLRYHGGTTIKGAAEQLGRPVQGLYKAMTRVHTTLAECIQRALMQRESS